MSQHNHIVSQDRIIASQRIEIGSLNNKLDKYSRHLEICKEMFDREKLRADLLKKALDRANLEHIKEVDELNIKLASLKAI